MYSLSTHLIKYSHSELQALIVSSNPSQFQIKASSTEETIDSGEIFTDIKEKWDAVENKSTVLLYGGGALVAIWISSIFIGVVNAFPLLPKIMELVGLGYSGWFVYRYLLFKGKQKPFLLGPDKFVEGGLNTNYTF